MDFVVLLSSASEVCSQARGRASPRRDGASRSMASSEHGIVTRTATFQLLGLQFLFWAVCDCPEAHSRTKEAWLLVFASVFEPR